MDENLVDLGQAMESFAPSAAPARSRAAPQAKTVSKTEAAVMNVQKFLIGQGLPVRAGQNQFPDGGWGKITNDSMWKFYDRLVEKNQAEQSSEFTQNLETLGKLLQEEPAATLANIHDIEAVLKDQRLIDGSNHSEEAGKQHQHGESDAGSQTKPQGAGIKQKERAPIFWDVTIQGSPNPDLNKTYTNVLINARTLENADYLEQLLIYKGMIDPASRGKDRAGQVRAAINGIVAALPEKFPGARYTAEMLGREIQQKALEATKNLHVTEYLKRRFSQELSKMPEAMRESAMYTAEDLLQRQNVLDENGYLKYQGAATPYEVEILRRLESYLRRIGT